MHGLNLSLPPDGLAARAALRPKQKRPPQRRDHRNAITPHVAAIRVFTSEGEITFRRSGGLNGPVLAGSLPSLTRDRQVMLRCLSARSCRRSKDPAMLISDRDDDRAASAEAKPNAAGPEHPHPHPRFSWPTLKERLTILAVVLTAVNGWLQHDAIQTMELAGGYAAAAVGFLGLYSRGSTRAKAAFAALMIFGGVLVVIGNGPTSEKSTAAAPSGLVVSAVNVMGTTASSNGGTAAPTAAVSAPSSTRSPAPAPAPKTGLPGVTLGPSVAVGLQPKALAVSGNRLWFVIDHDFGSLGLPDPVGSPVTRPVTGRPYDIAARGGVVAVVSGGWLGLFDSRTLDRLRDPQQFSEAPGPVAIGYGAVWIGNQTHSKVNRVDLGPKPQIDLNVTGPPNSILVAGRAVWAASDDGWITEIDPFTLRVWRIRIPDGPKAMAYGFGRLWVSHPQARIITRVDPRTRKVVGGEIAVSPDVRALALAGRFVWALSGSTDRIQRIDPKTGRVTGDTPVPSGSSDLVSYHGDLYVASENEGTVTRIRLRR